MSRHIEKPKLTACKVELLTNASTSRDPSRLAAMSMIATLILEAYPAQRRDHIL
jgi:hypothetical protein